MNNARFNLFIIITFMVLFSACSKPIFKSKWLKEEAPANFTARFETTKGVFDVEITKEWSPLAADRFYQTVKHRYYNNTVFYRVVPSFVAQWGNNDTSVLNLWGPFKLADEPVIQSNGRGYLSYARSGKETRGSTLFINLKDNPRLDTVIANGVKGYPPFGKVIKGMDVVDSLYSGYAGTTMGKLDTLKKYPELFFKQFPKLDKVIEAKIVRRT
jgi:peptidyl-prolyl cis-trans isomerase A (cyclophilin A)